MNVTLPAQLRQYVDREIKKGRFESATDVVADGLRLLEKRDQVAAGLQSAIVDLGRADADVTTMVIIVMMEAAKSAREDLKEIMQGVKAINTAKAALRKLIDQAAHDVAANADRKPPLRFSPAGIGSEKGYHRLPMPRLDPTVPGGMRMSPTDLHPGRINDAAVLCAIKEGLKNDLDSMSEMGEMESLRLQMAMDRHRKLMSTLSNLLKRISETQGGIIGNLK